PGRNRGAAHLVRQGVAPAPRGRIVTSSNRRRVVVTGVGAVTPVGTTVPTMWDALVAGASGVDQIRNIDASTFPTTIGAEIRKLDPKHLPSDPALLGLLDRKNQFGWVAAAEALADSKLLDHRPERIGISIGTESRRPDFLQQLSVGDVYEGD